MARIPLLLGFISLQTLESAGEPASIRWVEFNGQRTTVVNLGHGPGTFYIMNIKDMADLAIEDGQTREMTITDYSAVQNEFGDYPKALMKKFNRPPMPPGHSLDSHAAHDKWYRKALKKYHANKAQVQFHMHDDLWK